jgi:hypothetical protein
MSHSAIVVFTARSPQRIVREGGSSSWVLNAGRAENCDFLVCTQNQRNSWGDATQEHGSAFLIGRISGLEPMPEENGQMRWLIAISEYAFIDIANVWQGWRNPVRYATLEDLGIDPQEIDFQPMPPRTGNAAEDVVVEGGDADSASPVGVVEAVKPLSIPEAKLGLAMMFGVSADAIEITIRG